MQARTSPFVRFVTLAINKNGILSAFSVNKNEQIPKKLFIVSSLCRCAISLTYAPPDM